MVESNKSLSLAYKGLTFVPESARKRIRRLGIEELDLSHNRLSYPNSFSLFGIKFNINHNILWHTFDLGSSIRGKTYL